MTVAEMPIDARHPAALAVCHARVWPLPGDSAHHAERAARAIVRSVLGGADVGRDDMLAAEHIVAELALNAVQHAAPPYELRIVFVGRRWPTWCDVADGGTDPDRVRRRLHGDAATIADVAIAELAEGGRGLALVSGLCEGRCAAYPTTLYRTNSAGKAVGFALPGMAALGTDRADEQSARPPGHENEDRTCFSGPTT
jgi:anti-sigma regulatory factor (Ser/Thr protein kinase)